MTEDDHKAMRECLERAVLAGNQLGKTEAALRAIRSLAENAGFGIWRQKVYDLATQGLGK